MNLEEYFHLVHSVRNSLCAVCVDFWFRVNTLQTWTGNVGVRAFIPVCQPVYIQILFVP